MDLPPEVIELILKRDLRKRGEARTEGIIIFAVIVGIILCTSLALYFILRHYRIRNARPIYLPTSFLKTKWRAWNPGIQKHRPPSSVALHQDRSSYVGGASTSALTDPSRRAHGYDGIPAADAGERGGREDSVDRNTSVRSIMTLPAYSADARPSEQIMGREGDRAGIDTVVEYPENNDEEEARREEEMNSLYQIRQARREQQAARQSDRAAREELRRLRREARSRGDEVALRDLRRQTRQLRAESSAISSTPGRVNPDDMIAEHQSRERGRRISSVAYASLGVARHDGSRMRSDSASSDNRPLLDSAAAMGSCGPSPGGRPHSNSRSTYATSSLARAHPVTPHSDGDYNYTDSEQDSDFDMMHTPNRSRSHSHSNSNSRANSPRPISIPHSRLRVDSTSLHTVETALFRHSADEPHPPHYDNLSPIEREQERERARERERELEMERERARERTARKRLTADRSSALQDLSESLYHSPSNHSNTSSSYARNHSQPQPQPQPQSQSQPKPQRQRQKKRQRPVWEDPSQPPPPSETSRTNSVTNSFVSNTGRNTTSNPASNITAYTTPYSGVTSTYAGAGYPEPAPSEDVPAYEPAIIQGPYERRVSAERVSAERSAPAPPSTQSNTGGAAGGAAAARAENQAAAGQTPTRETSKASASAGNAYANAFSRLPSIRITPFSPFGEAGSSTSGDANGGTGGWFS